MTVHVGRQPGIPLFSSHASPVPTCQWVTPGRDRPICALQRPVMARGRVGGGEVLSLACSRSKLFCFIQMGGWTDRTVGQARSSRSEFRGKRLEGKVQVRLKWNKAPSCSLKVAPSPLQLVVTPREAAQSLEVCSPIHELKKKRTPIFRTR